MCTTQRPERGQHGQSRCVAAQYAARPDSTLTLCRTFTQRQSPKKDRVVPETLQDDSGVEGGGNKTFTTAAEEKKADVCDKVP